LPPGVSFSKQQLSYGFAYVFRHNDLGELGRIVLQQTFEGKTQISCEVAGDSCDPATTERAAIFGPLALEITEKMEASTGTPPSEPSWGGLPPRPSETTEVIESKGMMCRRCDAFVALLIFAPGATDAGRFEDYARKMYSEYARLNLPTWIIGPALGSGPLMDRPADILKVWPVREPIMQIPPDKFNAIVGGLAEAHCRG
jgi:hypothetical protein